jgi:hypothetical protein
VPLVAAAVCPHPPLLVPSVAAGAAPELDDLRSACDDAVAGLLAASPVRILVIGSGPAPSGAEVGRPDQPLSLAIGSWLLERAGTTGIAQLVPVDAEPADCAARGAALAGEPGPLALLVMGDGSACRGEKAPGYDDPRAEPFDTAAANALAEVDPAGLMALDPVLAAELRCAGRAPWQVLAGALIGSGRRWRGGLSFNRAPYGVAYFVATMTPLA